MSSGTYPVDDPDSTVENEDLTFGGLVSAESFEFGDFHENLAEISSDIFDDFQLPAIDYDDWSSIMSKVPEIVNAILGPEIDSPDTSLEQDETSENDIPASDDSKHFLESGCRLWEKYSASLDLPPLSWETSHTRQMFFMSLDIPLNLDNTHPSSHQKTKNDCISSIKIPSDISFKDALLKDDLATDDNIIPSDFDTQMIRFIHLKSDEALLNLSSILLKSHLFDLEIIQEKSNKYLAYWTEKKEAIESEKHIFEKVIESLVQHTKRQRIEHIKKTHNLKKS